ncbi:DUF4185 domain-containing protein [Halovenus marina]|uniref:DUF4185 domain-containing protein n=1 Tax=Halovenus marina TaxID=3396621 RepID=UPI003F54B8E3
MSGQDGAYSIPMEGEALWFFGDTLIGDRAVDERMPHGEQLREYGGFERLPYNCGLICRDSDGTDGLKNFEYILDDDGEIRQLVETHPDEDETEIRPWCLDGCYVDGTLYLYYVVVRIGSEVEDDFASGFELIGSGVARGSADDYQFTRVEHDNSSILWEKDQKGDRRDPHFGTAVLDPDDMDYVFVYGAEHAPAGVDDCYVARVPHDAIADVTAYEYFDGEGSWSVDLQDARPVFHGMPNEMSVSYNAHLDAYLTVYSLDQTGQVVGRTAPTPWGPWDDPVILWSVDPEHERLASHTPTYAGKEHPELAIEGGKKIYITYVEFAEYFPHLIEVELE